MTSVTTSEVAKKMADRGMLACLPKTAYWGDWDDNYIPSFGLRELDGLGGIFACIDVPNGYMEDVVDLTKKTREIYGQSIILIVGNVVTAEQTEALILAGADIVKVGIGSGSACSTRIKTGVGMPQLSAVIECADAAHGLGGHIISDGGCTVPGDIVKAFAGGADFVMLGGMLAGHDENAMKCPSCDGTSRMPIIFNGQEAVTPCNVCKGTGKSYDFYGMSSERANKEFSGGLRDYRASEGWELKLPNKGSIENTLQDIEGGLRSACSYIGACSIKDLPKCATFVLVNRQANTSLWEHRI
jgi:GMP reductase